MNFEEFLNTLEDYPQFKECLKELSLNKNIEVTGLVPGAKAFLLAGLGKSLARRILLVAPGIAEAEQISQDINSFGHKVYNFPAWEILPKEELLPHSDIVGEQLRILKILKDEKNYPPAFFVASAKAFYHNILSPSRFDHLSFELVEGHECNLDGLIKKLDKGGYSRLPLVEEKGNFSLRGGILDIFPLNEENPVRIEFFGDEVESIRYFDPLTQRSLKKVKRIFIPPALIQGESSLLEYLSSVDSIILDEPVLIKEQLTETVWQRFISFLKKKSNLYLSSLAQSLPDLPVPLNIRFTSGAVDVLWEDFSAFIFRLKKWQADDFKIALVSQNEGEATRLKELLQENKIEATENIFFTIAELNHGFILPDLKIILITDREIFHRYSEKRPRQRFKGGLPISTYRELEKGDLVVHLNYGIGKYQGIKKLKIQEGKKDFLAIEYQNNDILYVPIEQVKLVQKYVGIEGSVPRLYKLGGNAWFKVLKRTKKALRDMASELLALYAKRQMKSGYAFPADSQWQQEFDSAFIYEETPDQKEAILEVKRDLERSRPMDRLICGDVGYGKTEVAMRAAFKVATEGKQVAVLVPTTILAQQHFYTFRDRMADYPIRIEMLSRFKTPEEQKEIVKALASGKVDIVIGTHRLLQSDINFYNLGLLVIDEEQRFGVAHKEKIKKIKELVDVLTLTATPIPRTLYMSLTGMRDLSVIETPPRDRLPIETFVLEYDEKIVVEAIRREREREGQVFFVYNRIKHIYKVAGKLGEVMPHLRIGVAHGRMNERELEKVMLRFINREIDILVSTTIIESGLDIPNVNTIILTNAHQYGLADLYQLRGRVGRYKHRAYAYLFIPKGEIITGEAIKRLKTMEEFTELGAGIRIAMRDLEIRGAGNVLGPQQHGFITAVGFDLYCRLLQESVAELKGEFLPGPKLETKINLDVPEYIPDEYIPEARQKVEIYAKISSLNSLEDLEDLRRELIDRFGSPDEEMQILLDVAEVRMRANSLGIERIYREKSNRRINLQFNPEHTPDISKIEGLVKNSEVQLYFYQDKENRVSLKLNWDGEDRVGLSLLKKILQKQ